MSWLSEWMNPADPQDAVRAQQAEAQRVADAATAKEAADKAAAELKNQQMRTTATDAGRSSAQDYFSQLGLDPNQYSGDIDSKINEILGLSAPDDPNIGQYFQGLGETIYNTRQNAGRQQALRGVDSAFAPEFDRSRISDSFDDPFIADVNNEERGKADDYIQNLFKRGVINSTGVAGAEKNLDQQGAKIRTSLDDLGKGILDTGRQSLNDIANRGRTTASTLRLGQNFDPNSYVNEADTAFNDFSGKFGDLLRSRLPSGNLYDTSNLASVAGGAQGAQNLAFDPNAVAGKTNTLEEDDPFASLTKKAVF